MRPDICTIREMYEGISFPGDSEGEESAMEESNRKKWQCSPVFLSEESHEQRSLVGYSLWDRKESDTTKHTDMKG